MLGIFRAGAKNEQLLLKGGVKTVSVLFFISIILAAVIAILFYYFGRTKEKKGLMAFGFLLLLIALIASMVLHATGSESNQYRVVYTKDSAIVVINDEDGNTKRYDLDKVIHADVDFQIGDQVVVVTNRAGTPMYITPASQVAPQLPDPELPGN